MKTSEKIDALAAAMAKAQAKMPRIHKGRTADVVSQRTGKSFKFDYADLSDILDSVRPVLAEFDLAVIQGPGLEGGKAVLETRITHGSGQWTETQCPMDFAGPAQQRGSELTYLRRYCLCAILGIAAEEDDDGNAASGNQAKVANRPPRQQPKPPQPADVLTDPEEFRRALHGAFASREFDKDAEQRAAAAVLKGYGVKKLTELSLEQRHAVIDHVASGKADKYREAVQTA